MRYRWGSSKSRMTMSRTRVARWPLPPSCCTQQVQRQRRSKLRTGQHLKYPASQLQQVGSGRSSGMVLSHTAGTANCLLAARAGELSYMISEPCTGCSFGAFLGAPDRCHCLTRLTWCHTHMRRGSPEPSAASSGTSSMRSRAPTADTIADSKQVGSQCGRGPTSAAARLPNSPLMPASAPGLTCWRALQASMTSQASPGSGAVLALLTVERHSSLLYHITKAWLGAHMRAALSQVGHCMVRWQQQQQQHQCGHRQHVATP